MGNVRGLKNRLCPECRTLTPHRTIYARATVEGTRKWLPLFWACTRCHSLNHVIVLAYHLGRASVTLPSPLAVTVIRALEQAPLDFNELVGNLRRRQPPLPGHVFKAGVALSLEFLRDRGVVIEMLSDCTEKALVALRSRRQGFCPIESRTTLVSLYAQKKSPTHGASFVPAGVFCLGCGYQRLDW